MNRLPTLPYKKAYRGQWQHTSGHLRAQGCYEWMAEQLDELRPRRILDIGCGSGNGLLALISRFAPQTLVSLEENAGCIEATAETLAEAEQQPRIVRRLTYEQTAVGSYDVFCSDSAVELGPGVSIVQADIGCHDPVVAEALEREAPFDAITVWLIGTDRQLLQKLGSTPGQYRGQIHDRICRLTEVLLRPGGWLQFVDRCAFPLAAADEARLVESHRMMLEDSPLEFLKFSVRSYEEAGEAGIPLANASGQIGHGTVMGLKSVISWRPDDSALEAPGLLSPDSLQ